MKFKPENSLKRKLVVPCCSTCWFQTKRCSKVPATFDRLLTPELQPFLRQEGDFFSAGQCISTYGCCDTMLSSWCTTALANKNPRSLANWTCMGHDEAGTYFFSRACHNHCQIVTMGAKFLGQSIGWWHSEAISPFACDNTCLHCRQRGLHCVLMRLFWHPLLWHVCFIWSEFVIIDSFVGTSHPTQCGNVTTDTRTFSNGAPTVLHTTTRSSTYLTTLQLEGCFHHQCCSLR